MFPSLDAGVALASDDVSLDGADDAAPRFRGTASQDPEDILIVW